MVKRLLAILLLVIISSVCITAEEYKRIGWVKKGDAEVFLKYEKTESKDYEDFYQLTLKCGEDGKLETMITIGRSPKEWITKNARQGEVRVEYQFNRNSVLEDVWRYLEESRNKATITVASHPNFWTFYPPNPRDFAHKLLRVMEGEKTQFRFRETHKLLINMEGKPLYQETGQDTLHFDLRGDADARAVRDVLSKCKALP